MESNQGLVANVKIFAVRNLISHLMHLEGEADGVEGGEIADELSGAPALNEQEVGILDGESGLAAGYDPPG